MKGIKRIWLTSFLISIVAMPALIGGPAEKQASAQLLNRTFTETGKTVQGKFLEYWDKNGGLTQQGYPISNEMQEKSDTDGKTYTVQYFERAVFEMHPENQAPNDVLLSLLGVFLYKQKYPNGAPNQTANNQAGSRLFPETGKRVGGVFLDYWNNHGGLAQQGLPISDEFNEVSDLDGKTYKVQYFERAVFELHPENKAPYDVLLSQLGTFRYRDNYLKSGSGPAPTNPQPTAPPSSDGIAQPPEYAAVRARFENMTPDQWTAAGYTTSDEGAGCDPGVGYRIFNQPLWDAQFNSGKPDPQNPPILYTDRAKQQIIGLQWAASTDAQPVPVLFGQQMWKEIYSTGFPGYALFSFFKPNGYVLFAKRNSPDPCIPESSAPPASDAIPQTSEFAAVRARFENMTRAQWEAAGYTVSEDGLCFPNGPVPIENNSLFEAQFNSGVPDPQNPPILIMDRRTQRIIGLQWAVPAINKQPPVLFGQQMFSVTFMGDSRYHLITVFKPNGYVLLLASPCRAQSAP